MIRLPPRATRTDTLFPYTTLCRAPTALSIPQQIVLVTGGGRGLGQHIARAFLREGARVVVNYLNSADSAHKLAQESAGQALALQADVCDAHARSEEHTSELQSLMRISYAVFCLKKKNNTRNK